MEKKSCFSAMGIIMIEFIRNLFSIVKFYSETISNIRYNISDIRSMALWARANTSSNKREIDELSIDLRRALKRISFLESRISQMATENAKNSVEINKALKQISDQTTISADISPHSGDLNIVMVSGRYKNNDYVELISIPRDKDFQDVVFILKDLKKRNFATTRIDAPVGLKQIIKDV